mgnify:CR=1 FL=1
MRNPTVDSTAAAMSAGTTSSATRGKDVMLALLFVPVIFPLLYACVSATTCALVGGDVFADGFLTSLALGAGYDVIMILASWVLYDFVPDTSRNSEPGRAKESATPNTTMTRKA